MNRETLLVVDDSPENLILLELLLASENFSVRTADSARDALIALSSSLPDGMLTDIQMPEIDGLELIRQVRSDPRTCGIPILAVSANAMKENIQDAYEAGSDGYITKPIDTRTFGASVREYLELRRRGGGRLPKAPASEEGLLPYGDLLINCGRQIEQLLDSGGGSSRREQAFGILHQCAGTAGILGHPQISALARDLEAHSEVLSDHEFIAGLHRLSDLLAHVNLPSATRAR